MPKKKSKPKYAYKRDINITGHKGWHPPLEPVYEFDEHSMQIGRHNDIVDASVAADVSITSIRKSIKHRIAIKGKYFSYNPDIKNFV